MSAELYEDIIRRAALAAFDHFERQRRLHETAPELLRGCKALLKWDDSQYPGDREGSEMDRDEAMSMIRRAVSKIDNGEP